MIERPEIVVILAKEPKPGLVKTRLQSQFSPEEAAQLAAAAVRDTQRAVRASQIPRRILCWDGDPSDFAKSSRSALAPSTTASLAHSLTSFTAQHGCC